MNERLRWWVLPASMIVLLRVVTLDSPARPDPVTAPAVATGATVALLDAAGRRTAPVAVPATAGAFLVTVPDGHAGQRGELTLWRRTVDGREPTPWLAFTPRVPADATVKVAGLQAGSYDVEWRLGEAVLVAEGAAAPGTVRLQPAAVPPR